MSDQSWTVEASEPVFAAPPYVAVTRERIRTPGGVTVENFYRVDLAAFALCVPVTASGHVVTLWEYKHGPGRVSLGFPAGLVDAGEAPEAAGVRELREETGYAAGGIEPLGAYVDNGNQRGALGHYFVAHDCTLVTTPLVDPLESGEVRLMTPREIDAALDDGAFGIIHHVAAWGMARKRLAL